MRTKGFVLIATLVLSVGASADDFEYIETVFQCKEPAGPVMLCCRPGFYAVGYHNQKNHMLCSESPFSKQPTAWDTQLSKEQAGEAVRCPKGWAVAGYHDQASTLLCRRPKGKTAAVEPESLQDPEVDSNPATQREGMHACPIGYALVGIHNQKNRFWCAKPTK